MEKLQIMSIDLTMIRFFCKIQIFVYYSIDKNVQEKAAKSDRVLIGKVEVHVYAQQF